MSDHSLRVLSAAFVLVEFVRGGLKGESTTRLASRGSASRIYLNICVRPDGLAVSPRLTFQDVS